MTNDEKRTAEEILTGYGAQHTAAEWAKLLDMKTGLFLYLTHTEGMTVEQVYEFRKMKYQPPKKRKPRISEAMERTKERMKILLDVSDYGDEDTWETIEVKRVGYNGIHAVSYLGKPLGTYKYRTGQLRLSGGQGIPLWDMEWEDAKICQNDAGLWEPHPDTHAIMQKRAIRSNADDMKVLDAYEHAVEKAERAKSTGPELYEGFGKRYTCPTWAKVLDVPERTLRYNLKQGKTIEEFAAERGIRKI